MTLKCRFRINSIKAYKHWRPSRNLTIELGIKDHITNMWHMTLMWMVHAVIINEIWHSGLLLLICNKKTFMAQNKSTVLILHPVLGYLGRSGLLSPVRWKPTTQLSVKILAICQLSGNLIQTLFYRSRTLPQALRASISSEEILDTTHWLRFSLRSTHRKVRSTRVWRFALTKG